MMMNGYARNNSSDNFVIVVFCVCMWGGGGWALNFIMKVTLCVFFLL